MDSIVLSESEVMRMNQMPGFRNQNSLVWRLFFAVIILSFSTGIFAQTSNAKPLMIIKVENEGENLTRAAGIVDLTPAELSELRISLKRELGEVFTIIPESDKRDCIELGISVEKLATPRQVLYVASSAIAVGKGESDLLLTHNVVAQPSLAKITATLQYQLSSMVLQSQLRNVLK
jgi:hypothetical protein